MLKLDLILEIMALPSISKYRIWHQPLVQRHLEQHDLMEGTKFQCNWGKICVYSSKGELIGKSV